MGLTLGCARCHDHKFDPLTQKEFYQFFAYFNNLDEKGMVWNFGNEDPLIKAPLPEQEAELARLDERLRAAGERYDALADSIASEQRAWEAKLRESTVSDWSVGRGLAVHFPLDGHLQIESRFGGSIDGKLDPTPIETTFAAGRLYFVMLYFSLTC